MSLDSKILVQYWKMYLLLSWQLILNKKFSVSIYFLTILLCLKAAKRKVYFLIHRRRMCKDCEFFVRQRKVHTMKIVDDLEKEIEYGECVLDFEKHLLTECACWSWKKGINIITEKMNETVRIETREW